MKLLKEEDIFNNTSLKSASVIDPKLKLKDKLDLIIKNLKEKYGESDYKKFVLDQDLEEIITNSIINDGSNTSNNPMIELLDALITKTKNPIPDKLFVLLSNILKSKSIRLQDNLDWVGTIDSNISQFKIKSLAFLRSNEAKNFGDNPEKAIKDILNMQDDNDIKAYLSNWQTKSGDFSKGNTIFDSIKKQPEQFFTSNNLVGVDFNKINKATDLTPSLIKSFLLNIDQEHKYSDIINNIAEPKNTPNEDYWQRYQRNLLRKLDNEPSSDKKEIIENIKDFLQEIFEKNPL